MLYRTRDGRLIDEYELNALESWEVEDQGIHATESVDFWREEA